LSNTQLAFAGVVSLLLYIVFVFVLTVRHREHFLPPSHELPKDYEPMNVKKPSNLAITVSFIFLLISLVAVVGLAKTLAPTIESAVAAISAPIAVVGIVIALLVLLPETLSAVQAALRNRMQISFNLALGSALATIGLTIPTVALISLTMNLPLELGLPPKEMAMLALTLLTATMTLSRNSATVLQGAVHLVLFAVFLFLSVFP
jgi:Ca2+:H+ antiporter